LISTPKTTFCLQQVFTFFMLNAVFVTAIYLLQQNKESIFIRWPLGAKANVTYIQSSVIFAAFILTSSTNGVMHFWTHTPIVTFLCYKSSDTNVTKLFNPSLSDRDVIYDIEVRVPHQLSFLFPG
jgi:hypothetical protein